MDAGLGDADGAASGHTIEEFAQGIAIFATLSRDAIGRIERRCAWKRYAPGEPILEYLDASDDVFFITLGEVRVTIYSSVGKGVSLTPLSRFPSAIRADATWEVSS